MGSVKEIVGNLITMALNADFEVIAQCCNCFCVQKSGIAVQMSKHFGTDKFDLEGQEYEGDVDKLGRIEFKLKPTATDKKNVYVVNMYGQYHFKQSSPYKIPLDYDALRLCFRKLNASFKESSIGLPGLIGCGLAGGDAKIVKKIIEDEMKDCDVTIVYLTAPF